MENAHRKELLRIREELVVISQCYDDISPELETAIDAIDAAFEYMLTNP